MNELARYDAARRALAEAHRIDEVKGIRDKARAMQEYARQAKDGQMIEWATDIRLRAERRAGQLLAEIPDSPPGPQPRELGNERLPNSRPPTLADLGVTKTQSSRWQKLAALDEQTFEERASVAKRAAIHSLEATGAERAAEKRAERERREAELARRQLALPAKRYGVILADPEWRFEVWSRETGLDRSADNHYPTSALNEIKARDVASIAADDCVLFLWATAPMLPHALEVMGAWGFAYKTHSIWAKDRIGTGYWWRNKHELLLTGTRGGDPRARFRDPGRFADHGSRRRAFREARNLPRDHRTLLPLAAQDRTQRAPPARRLGSLGRRSARQFRRPDCFGEFFARGHSVSANSSGRRP
jgi:hypothetical protein